MAIWGSGDNGLESMTCPRVCCERAKRVRLTQHRWNSGLLASGVRWLGRFAWLYLPMVAAAQPIFLDVATSVERRDLRVFSGRKATFVLSLAAETVVTPEIRADLGLIGGPLVAPVASNMALAVRARGEPRAGLQRFEIDLEVPAGDRPARFLLRMSVRTNGSDSWLPLPAVLLNASNETWPDLVRTLSKQMGIDWSSGGERIQALRRAASVADGDGPHTRPGLWLSEGDSGAMAPASAIPVLFRAGLMGEILVVHEDERLVVQVDERALRVVDGDAEAQALLERALRTASALVEAKRSAESDSP